MSLTEVGNEITRTGRNIAMKKHLFILLFVLLWVQPIYGQEKGNSAPRRFSFVVTTLDQPDSPLTFVEMGLQTPKPGVAFIWFTVKNRSDKAIIGWEVEGFKDGWPIAGWGQGWIYDDERPDVIQTVLKPGERDTCGRLAPHVLERVANEYKNVKDSPLSISLDLAVVKVRFADGTKYDAVEWLQSLGWHPIETLRYVRELR
jgi:hypothetical protein